MVMEKRIAILYATRFGTTRLLAERIGEVLEGSGVSVTLSSLPSTPPREGAILLMTAIIWDRALPAFRAFLAEHLMEIAPRVIGLGVVCGSAGVRPQGGRGYLRRLVRAFPSPPPIQFALSGRIPPREELTRWEYSLLRLFSLVMRKPQLFTIQPDLERARSVGERILQHLEGSTKGQVQPVV
jgi:menaquinone-dependent protoporphyrinogen IX oxidase